MKQTARIIIHWKIAFGLFDLFAALSQMYPVEVKSNISTTHLFDTAVTGVGSSPALATCKTGQVLLAGVSGGFPEVLPFRPIYRLARLDMSE